jgi:hypothetical protein
MPMGRKKDRAVDILGRCTVVQAVVRVLENISFVHLYLVCGHLITVSQR